MRRLYGDVERESCTGWETRLSRRERPTFFRKVEDGKTKER